MAIPPQYQFKLAAGSDPLALVNVETLTAGGRYFYAPTLEEDFILQQTGGDGLIFDRGYQRFVWRIDLWVEQYEYLYTTILNNSFMGPVVFQTKRIQKATTYQIWTGKLRIPLFNEFQRNYRQYQGVPLTFTRCQFVS